MNYESQIRNYIKPNLGEVPLLLLVRDASERLEAFYARLRLCRQLCSGRPFIEEHLADGPHDCDEADCRVHVCKPYAAGSIRQIHAILSGALSAAVRWAWGQPVSAPPGYDLGGMTDTEVASARSGIARRGA